MSDFSWSKKREGTPPAWQTSAGKMQERAPEEKRDGKNQLTGYEASEQERTTGDRPREAARMSGSYGDVAVGVNKKKEMLISVSEKRRYREGTTRRDEQRVRGDGSRKMNLARGNFQTNSHDGKNSAVVYREKAKRSPGRMLGKMKNLMRTQEQNTLQEQIPFLSRRKERRELRALKEQMENLRAKGGEKSLAMREMESRRHYLQRSIQEKKVQERQLRKSLQKAQQEAKKVVPASDDLRFLTVLLPVSEEDGTGDSGEDKPEETPEEIALNFLVAQKKKEKEKEKKPRKAKGKKDAPKEEGSEESTPTDSEKLDNL